MLASILMSLSLVSFLGFGSVAFGQDAAAPDAKFLDQMSEHHRGGVEMAKMAEKKAQTPALKKMSAKMVKDQSKEIEQMAKWRSELFASAPKSTEMPPKMDMSHLEQTSGKEFDKMFLEMMSKHHDDGIKMVQNFDAQLQNPTVKKFAQNVAKNQNEEKKKMSKMENEIAKK